MDKLVAHKLRSTNRIMAKGQIKRDAKELVAAYINDNPLIDVLEQDELHDHYQAINTILEYEFDTPNKFQMARKGFLGCIREYNKTHKLQLDEPVVPILAERDNLTIGYEWFVNGS
jgi:hypothetical protein